MQDQLTKLKTTPAVQGTFTVLTAAYRLAEIVVPAGMSYYLIMNFTDIVILIVAAGLALFAALRLVRAVWLSVTLQNKKRK